MNARVRLASNGDYWQASYDDEKGRRRRKSLGPKAELSRAQGLAACDELGRALEAGSLVSGRKTRLRAWVDRYAELREPDVSDGTMRTIRATGDLLVRGMGDVPIRGVTPAEVDDWLSWLRSKRGGGLRATTAAAHGRRARAMFRRAVARGELKANPFEAVQIRGARADRDDPIPTDEQVQALIDQAPGPAWRAMVGLCALAGLRRGEALRMTFADVLWGEGRLIVRNPGEQVTTKGRRRVVLMTPELEWILLDAQDAVDGTRPTSGLPAEVYRPMVELIARATDATPARPFQALRKWRDTTWRFEYPGHVVDSWLGHSAQVAREHYARIPEALYATCSHTPMGGIVGKTTNA